MKPTEAQRAFPVNTPQSASHATSENDIEERWLDRSLSRSQSGKLPRSILLTTTNQRSHSWPNITYSPLHKNWQPLRKCSLQTMEDLQHHSTIKTPTPPSVLGNATAGSLTTVVDSKQAPITLVRHSVTQLSANTTQRAQIELPGPLPGLPQVIESAPMVTPVLPPVSRAPPSPGRNLFERFLDALCCRTVAIIIDDPIESVPISAPTSKVREVLAADVPSPVIR